jgi:V/A-type H+-transporting ATPase subunit D
VARRFKLTQPELKLQRGRLRRFERYLPLLKLKQQQLQLRLAELEEERRGAEAAVAEVERRLSAWSALMGQASGVDLEALARPVSVETGVEGVAGLRLPTLGAITFPPASYSLFGTPAWVDRGLDEVREATRCRLRVETLREAQRLLGAELARVIQRVNLFEKVLIPGARQAIRVIRIKLGDDMTAGVGRAKIAKSKLTLAAQSIELPA